MAKNNDRNKAVKRSKKTLDKTVQQAIPFIDVFNDGIFQIAKTQFSKMYSFMDSNFIVEPESKQIDILLDYAKVLNKFPTNVSLQLVILNKRTTLI